MKKISLCVVLFLVLGIAARETEGSSPVQQATRNSKLSQNLLAVGMAALIACGSSACKIERKVRTYNFYLDGALQELGGSNNTARGISTRRVQAFNANQANYDASFYLDSVIHWQENGVQQIGRVVTVDDQQLHVAPFATTHETYIDPLQVSGIMTKSWGDETISEMEFMPKQFAPALPAIGPFVFDDEVIIYAGKLVFFATDAAHTLGEQWQLPTSKTLYGRKRLAFSDGFYGSQNLRPRC